jgi:hypothetical protein
MSIEKEGIDEKKYVLIYTARKKYICIKCCVTLFFIIIYYNKTAYGLFISFTIVMIYRDIYFSIVFTIIMGKCCGLFSINWDDRIDNSSEIIPNDIYKCVSYTAAHIDISHWINQEFSNYKDCQASGLYTLNRRDRQFKIEIDVQRSWIVHVSLFNIISPYQKFFYTDFRYHRLFIMVQPDQFVV